jgi:hypothetical protein
VAVLHLGRRREWPQDGEAKAEIHIVELTITEAQTALIHRLFRNRRIRSLIAHKQREISSIWIVLRRMVSRHVPPVLPRLE